MLRPEVGAFAASRTRVRPAADLASPTWTLAPTDLDRSTDQPGPRWVGEIYRLTPTWRP
eukprot:gene12599-biopygen2423